MYNGNNYQRLEEVWGARRGWKSGDELHRVGISATVLLDHRVTIGNNNIIYFRITRREDF
jgi:hypothetical protein